MAPTASENFSSLNCPWAEQENAEIQLAAKANCDIFSQDCQQIKELLSEVSTSPVAEVKPDTKLACETDSESVVTEPTDSPFRVRRVARSFSISHTPLTDQELFCSDSCEDESSLSEKGSPLSGKKSRFLILRRSRSLGNIFANQFEIPRSRADTQSQSDTVVTEQVEALEVEVLPKDEESSIDSLTVAFNQRVSISALIDDPQLPEKREESPSPMRPQTTPPALFNAPLEAECSESTGKMSILDRMQKSLGFFFKCARRGSVDANSAKSNLAKTPNLTAKSCRARSRAIEQTNAKFFGVASKSSEEEQPLPIAEIHVNTSSDAASFITKLDSPPPIGIHKLPIRTLPTFHDVSGPKGPLLPAPLKSDFGRKCLVLDLDETLVHSSFHIPDAFDLVVPLSLPDGGIQNIYVAKRPGVDEFLARVGELFEVVIFTASLSRYADPVVDFLVDGMRKFSESAVIRHRLYRESCLYLQGLYVKDLSRLGRDLNQVVIVDNSPASFLLQPDNGVAIKSWFSDTTDCELALLLQSLNLLASSTDVYSWKFVQ